MSSTPQVLQAPVSRTKAKPPRLRPASFEDHEQIALLESRYGLVAKSYEEWRHLWLGNPLYRELRAGWSIGWVLEDEHKNIVGTMGNIPLQYELEGRKILASSGRSWVVEPAYRSAGLLLLDHVINQRGVDLYVNTTVGVESVAAVETLECSRMPVGQWDESAFWITHYPSFFELRLARRNWPFAKPLSYPLSAAAALRDRLTTKSLRAGDVEVKACASFDERFDDLWAGLKQRHPHLLLGVRSREMLDWHYKHALLNGKVWIATVVDGSRLVAYATFERKDRPTWGVTRVRLVDFQSLDGSTALLQPLLRWAMVKCRDERIHTLDIVGRWLEHGAYPLKLGAWSHFYRANDSRLAESLKNPAAWAPTLFDGDASL